MRRVDSLEKTLMLGGSLGGGGTTDLPENCLHWPRCGTWEHSHTSLASGKEQITACWRKLETYHDFCPVIPWWPQMTSNFYLLAKNSTLNGCRYGRKQKGFWFLRKEGTSFCLSATSFVKPHPPQPEDSKSTRDLFQHVIPLCWHGM